VNPWNLAGRLRRRLVFERAERRFDRDFRLLMDSAPRAYGATGITSDGPRVGFATFGSGRWHLVLELLLAHGLALRGARPELLICDVPTLPVCDERTCFDRDSTCCRGCVSDKQSILDGCGITWRGLSSFEPRTSLDRARQLVESLQDDELHDFVYGSWPIGQWTFVSTCHFLRRDARSPNPEHLAARRLFLSTAILIAESVERWLDEIRPDVVVAESGAHFMWRIAFELARARGIRVVCREIGKGGFDTHIYSVNAECMFPNWRDVWSACRDVPLSPEQDRDVSAYLRALPAKTYGGTTDAEEDANATSKDLDAAAKDRVVVLFTNVTWDLATAGRDLAFDGMFDWLCETLTLAERTPAVQFVIRVHPAEEHVLTRDRVLEWLREKYPRLPSNVTTIPSGSPVPARTLCEKADLVVTYCSTTGIEAAIHGKPVLVSGTPHYREKGFTIDVRSKADYHDTFARWLRGGLQPPPNASQLARRYFHLFFLRYHLAMGWTTSPLEPPFELRIKDLSDLLPGRNPAVDAVCSGVLSGQEILL
jgi:Capsule polysaccharide biosynthesis protein